MELKNRCAADNFVWRNRYAYAYRSENGSGQTSTVLRYRLPYHPDDEAALLEMYHVSPGDRMTHYQNLAFCVDREVSLSEKLHNAGIPSLLTFFRVEQSRDEKGAASILLETENIWPISQKLLHGSIHVLTAIDLISRLSIILRDLAKMGVVHRGLDLDEVYINEQNRILLGGMFYANHPEQDKFLEYLADHPANVPEQLLEGDVGHAGTDMLMLSRIAWNIFSGLPWNTQFSDMPLVFPEYATPELADILRLGLMGREEDCAQFRKRLVDYRKQCSKTEHAQLRIPIPEPARKQYRIVTT